MDEWIDAAQKGDMDKVMELVNKGVDMNIR